MVEKPTPNTESVDNSKRRFVVGSALTAVAGGGWHVASVMDDKAQKNAEQFIRDMTSASSNRTEELRHRYSVEEIVKQLAPLDVFPAPGTSQEDIDNAKAKLVNTKIENIPNATRFSDSSTHFSSLDAVIAQRSAADAVDRKAGFDLSDLVKGLIKIGAKPTEQTMRLAQARIERSKERIGTDPESIWEGRLKEYDWKRDVEVMEKVKQELMKAKYTSQGASAAQR